MVAIEARRERKCLHASMVAAISVAKVQSAHHFRVLTPFRGTLFVAHAGNERVVS